MHGIAPEYLGPVVRVTDLPSRQSLCSAGTNRLLPNHRLNSQQLILELSRWPVAPGIVCQQTLHRHRRQKQKLIYTDNHFLISPLNDIQSLGGTFGDNHLGHLKHWNWIELSPTLNSYSERSLINSALLTDEHSISALSMQSSRVLYRLLLLTLQRSELALHCWQLICKTNIYGTFINR